MSRSIIATFLYNMGFEPREYRLNNIKKHSWFKGDDLAFEKEKNKLREKTAPKKNAAI